MKALKSLVIWLLAAVLLSSAGTLAARSFWFSGNTSETTHLEELPAEARTTLRLIQRGGPFPYRRDGVEFQNREGRLPKQSRGYYHEYTVPTPGARDRGARRIVSGESNEYYYSPDHYRSFQRIKP